MTENLLPVTLETIVSASRTRNQGVTLHPGTVTAIVTTSKVVDVLIDGSTTVSRVSYLSGLPGLSIGTRVMVMFYPPQGAIIIGTLATSPGFIVQGGLAIGNVTLNASSPGVAISDVMTIPYACSLVLVTWALCLNCTTAGAAGTGAGTWVDEDAAGADFQEPATRCVTSFTGTTTIFGTRTYFNTPAGKQFQIRGRKGAGSGAVVATAVSVSGWFAQCFT